MAHCKSRILNGVLLFWCLANLCAAENICELPNAPMFCSCDISEPHEETETINCFVFGNVTQDDLIWDYFTLKTSTKHLTFDSLIGNELKFIPTEVIQTLLMLKSITFRQSKLGILESYTFSKLVSVTGIFLNSNEIMGFQEKCFYKMHKLNQLALGINNIKRISPNVFVDLPALQYLYLERNNINKLEANAFQSLHNLSELDLHMNRIHEIERGAFRGLDNLVRLDMFKNRLETLKADAFSFLPNLVELEISENRISEIEADAFKGLDQLITLRLKNNRIMRLPSGLFTRMPQLMRTYLSNNRLKSMTSTTIEEFSNRFKEPFFINIDDNNLICDCDLWWWTTKYFNTSQSLEWKRLIRNVQCRFPEGNGVMQQIVDLLPSDINCSEMKTTLLTTEEILESPAILLVNEVVSSESSSSQIDDSQKHALSDESQEKHTEDSMIIESTDYPLKQDSHVTKATEEVQESSQISNTARDNKAVKKENYNGNQNSIHYSSCNFSLTAFTILLAFLRSYCSE